MKSKMLKKLISLFLVIVTAFSFTACTPTGGDSTKFELKIRNYGGGFGDEWLVKAAADFEALYEGVEYGGKVGVDVVYSSPKNDSAETDMQSDNHIVVREFGDIYSSRHSEFLEIDSVFTDTLSDGKTIESKLYAGDADKLKINGHYYAVPHYEIFGGITYDKGLFKERSFYISATGGWVNGTNKSVLSNGPDGVKCTHANDVICTCDDGLPANYEEFKALLERMKGNTVTPMLWSGQSDYYANYMLSAMYACLMGKNLNYVYDLDSKGNNITYITGFDGDNPTTVSEPITTQTAYKLYTQKEKYEVISFLDSILGSVGVPSNYVDRIGFSGTKTMKETQKIFIQSKRLPQVAGSERPIAMLVEGNYWTHESKTALAQEAAKGPQWAKTYGYMPMPAVVSGSVDATTGVNSYTLVDSASCYMVINKRTVEGNQDLINLAKEFIKFCNTDEKLQEFTTLTNTTKGLKYPLTKTQYDSLSHYGKSVWDLREKAIENGVIFSNKSANAVFRKAYSDFAQTCTGGFWSSGTTRVAVQGLFTNGQTAKEYFNGMKKLSAQEWTNTYQSYWG